MESVPLVIGLIALIGVLFFVLREVFLWYWKINLIVKNLEDILGELKKR